MNICIVRHGETDWNVSGRFQGREDIPLNQNGILQAKQCGDVLNSQKWDAIITSPLSRARQTAQSIASILNISELYEDIDLVERDLGKASGLTPEERKSRYPNGNYEGMEKWEVMRDRFYNVVLKYIDLFSGKDIIIVSHGGTINSLLAELTNHKIGTGKTKIKNACINLLDYSNGELKIIFYNKQAHEINFSLGKWCLL